MTEEIRLSLDLSTNRLRLKGENFEFECENDLTLGQLVRVILSSRERGEVQFGSMGAPSSQLAQHLTRHSLSRVRGCPWCEGVSKTLLSKLVADLPTPKPSLDKLDL